MLKGSEVKALQRGLRCLFKTGSLYRIQTPPVLSQGAVFETVRTAVRLKPKLQKTVRSRHYIGSTSFNIPNKHTLTVWGTPRLYLSGFNTKIHATHQSPRNTRTIGHQHIQRFNSGTIQQAM